MSLPDGSGQIGLNDIKDPEDIFPFALDGSAVEGRLYGIPVFLCGNFLIYDQQYQALAAAEHLTDLAGLSGILVISSEKASSRHQYTIEVIADKQGAGNPDIDDGSGDEMLLIDSLAVEGQKQIKASRSLWRTIPESAGDISATAKACAF